MRAHRTNRLITITIALSSLLLTAGCGDDDPTGTGSSNPLVGTWNATSFVVGGFDLIDAGATFSLTLAAGGTESSTITGDTSMFFCETTVDCTDSGTWTSTSTTLTFDPGTVDEFTVTYTISGSTLNFSGTIESTLLSGTFTKVS